MINLTLLSASTQLPKTSLINSKNTTNQGGLLILNKLMNFNLNKWLLI